jgi:hypothetical protein
MEKWMDVQNVRTDKKEFRALSIGDTFDFVNMDRPMMNSFYRRCVKTSARKYQTIDEPKDTYSVGSINARVYHVRDANARITFREILSRDVPIIVTHVRELARAGICAPIALYYKKEAIAGQSEAVSHDMLADGWTSANASIPCGVPYEAYFRYIYDRAEKWPLFA